MGAAEDAIRDRLNSEARAAAGTNRPAQDWPAQLRRQIRDDIPAVLGLLHQLQWPDATLISVSTEGGQRGTLIGELKAEAKDLLSEVRGMLSEITGRNYKKPAFMEFGAQKIYDNESSEPSEWMYLLSDGRITMGSDPVDIDDLHIERLRGCAKGIAALKEKLTRKAG